MPEFADYIIYLDESGSPTLGTIDKDFPVFVLACICVETQDYVTNIVPRFQKLKFKYFGHDQIILHEREIRRQSHEFAFLQVSKDLRNEFLNEITAIIEEINFSVSATVVKKQTLKDKYPNPWSPYEISLLLCMEHLALTLQKHDQLGRIVHIVAESRGHKEDAELELVFRRIADGETPMRSNQARLLKKFQWRILFKEKKCNSTGLQLADLIARPIGLSIAKPDQINRAYQSIENKIRWWLKCFP